MELRRIFMIFFVYILVVFGFMLTASYAWYSFANGATTFDAVTGKRDKEIAVMYDSGSYINTTTAIPIDSSSEENFLMYADRSTFSVEVTDFANNNQVAIEIKVRDIEISDALKNKDFRYSFLYNDSELSSGNFSEIGSSDKLVLEDNLTVSKDSVNNFELRLWIEDSDDDQSSMENQTFRGTIEVTVISR